MFSNFLRGTGVAVVTPFHADHSVDYVSLTRIIKHLLAGGVDYLVLLGTTAETVSLRAEEKCEIVRFVTQDMKPAVPIVVGVGGNSIGALEADLEKLPLSSADALMIVTPYYSKPSQAGLYAYYAHAHAITEKLSKPILLYNVPSRTGITILPETVAELARDFSRIVGIKEASADLAHCVAMRLKNPAPFRVIAGNDAFVTPLVAMGMDGLISVCANAYPKEVVEITRAAMQGEKVNNEKALFLHDLDRLCFVENNPAGVKCFLSELALCEHILRLPLVPLSEKFRGCVRALMKR